MLALSVCRLALLGSEAILRSHSSSSVEAAACLTAPLATQRMSGESSTCSMAHTRGRCRYNSFAQNPAWAPSARCPRLAIPAHRLELEKAALGDFWPHAYAWFHSWSFIRDVRNGAHASKGTHGRRRSTFWGSRGRR